MRKNKKYTKDLQSLVINLKNGDALAFYHTKWYMIFSKLIAFFSGFKMDHIACVQNVKHVIKQFGYDDIHEVYFDLYEATTVQGIHKTAYYLRSDGETNLPLKGRKLYYVPLTKVLTKEKSSLFNASLECVLGRKFDWFRCILVPFNKIITLFNNDYKHKILPKAFCALYIATANRDAKLIPSFEYWRDPYMTPFEVANYSCYKGIYEISTKTVQ